MKEVIAGKWWNAKNGTRNIENLNLSSKNPTLHNTKQRLWQINICNVKINEKMLFRTHQVLEQNSKKKTRNPVEKWAEEMNCW